MNRKQITERFKHLQDEICRALETMDGKGSFTEDIWKRKGGGGGRTRIILNGDVIEKGGVNFSAVYGSLSKDASANLGIGSAKQNPENDRRFYATGISAVMHPLSPMVPIIHMNVRYFEISGKDKKKPVVKWFGGGIDLTPHYIDAGDASFFHKKLKEVCSRFSDSYYPEFKKCADEYFFLKHRNETRGIGGIFFYRLTEEKGFTTAQRFEFVIAVAGCFTEVYSALVQKHRHQRYGKKEKQWQKLRRGRYVEFNLICDKGTKFGLASGGNTESVFMSLPPDAIWAYDLSPAPNSPEQKTLDLLKKGISW